MSARAHDAVALVVFVDDATRRAWTRDDACCLGLFVLLATASSYLVCALHARRRAHARAPFQRVVYATPMQVAEAA